MLARLLPRKGLDQDYFCVLVPQALPADPQQRAAALLAQYLLGRAQGGRLDQALRVDRGWDCGVESFCTATQWGIRGKVARGRLKALLELLPAVVAGLTESPPDDAALEQLKAAFDANWLRRRVLASDRVDAGLRDLLWSGNADLAAQTAAAVRGLRRADLLVYARRLSLANGSLALCGDPDQLRQTLQDLNWDVTDQATLKEPL